MSLYQLIDRRERRCRFETRAELASYFGLDASTKVIASGTAEDPPLERWWGMGSRRREILGQLRDLGVLALTAPNFSVFSDVPRWDNLHAIKRIAICWGETLEMGIPCALHVNARTDRDWERWTAFVAARPEIDAVAYEFATGAATRFEYHLEHLCRLGDRVSRPLSLVVRGALCALPKLRDSYANVSLLDSNAYMRSVNRMHGVVRESGGLYWIPSPDRPDVDVASLLEHNHLTILKAIMPRQTREA